MTEIKKNFYAIGGKIKLSLLIVALAVIVFFIAIAWIQFYMTPSFVPAAASGDSLATTSTPTTISTVGTSTTVTKGTPNTSTITVSSDGHSIGIAGGGVLSKLSTVELNRELDQMVALGDTWVRFDIEWGNVQYGSPNTSTWSSYDTLVNAIAAHHLKGLAVILFTPGWARDSACSGGAKCPPKDPTTYATFAAQVAARYKDKGVNAFEIWNEENSYDFWATKTDCKAYTNLLKATYPAIKKADPIATVITGGLAPLTTDNHNISQLDFLNCIYTNGGQNYFDAVGDHPYTYPSLPSSSNTNAWARMSLTSPSLRSIMVANGDAAKKIWITEFGTPTNGPDSHWFVSEAVQAQMVTDAMTLYKSYPWAGPLFLYTIKDGSTSTDSNENFFGLTRFDGSLKPAYTALKNIISAGL